MADVFISYSKKKPEVTKDLAGDLAARGLSVWWDTALVPVGDFDTQILAELAAARAVIVIWTAQSVTSAWVKSEANRANKAGKLIQVAEDGLDLDLVPPPFDVGHIAFLSDRDAIYRGLAALGVEVGETGRVARGRLIGFDGAGISTLTTSATTAPPDEALGRERRDWLLVWEDPKPDKLVRFLRQYPNGQFAPVARERLSEGLLPIIRAGMNEQVLTFAATLTGTPAGVKAAAVIAEAKAEAARKAKALRKTEQKLQAERKAQFDRTIAEAVRSSESGDGRSSSLATPQVTAPTRASEPPGVDVGAWLDENMPTLLVRAETASAPAAQASTGRIRRRASKDTTRTADVRHRPVARTPEATPPQDEARAPEAPQRASAAPAFDAYAANVPDTYARHTDTEPRADRQPGGDYAPQFASYAEPAYGAPPGYDSGGYQYDDDSSYVGHQAQHSGYAPHGHPPHQPFQYDQRGYDAGYHNAAQPHPTRMLTDRWQEADDDEYEYDEPEERTPRLRSITAIGGLGLVLLIGAAIALGFMFLY
ncbi:MAG: TIR domain-containing protein [Rhizobiales bacterium]|nr:TIR domain-containing protein [Hyphomicrobiales bacterium]